LDAREKIEQIGGNGNEYVTKGVEYDAEGDSRLFTYRGNTKKNPAARGRVFNNLE
jgi:hypothetical protein